jgi:dipeptidyl aminopeptidase/acylaminoacyl peptidase
MGQEESLLEGDSSTRNPLDWSPDGKYILFGIGDLTTRSQIWVLPLFGDRKPVPLTQESVVAGSARFSPDGHWVAYSSNESGRQEVYVIPFLREAGKWQISNTGGVQPMWRKDGKELFYWSAENTLMSVPITLEPAAVKVGAVHPLFRFNNPVGIIGIVSPYDIAVDGQRVVVITTSEQAPRSFTLVTNWTEELKNE